MASNETKNVKLNELRVVDLKHELENRDLDRNGVKAILLERLQTALKEEGHDPETYVFQVSADGKKTPGKGKNDDDKGEEDEDMNKSEQTKEIEEAMNEVPKSDNTENTVATSSENNETKVDDASKKGDLANPETTETIDNESSNMNDVKLESDTIKETDADASISNAENPSTGTEHDGKKVEDEKTLSDTKKESKQDEVPSEDKTPTKSSSNNESAALEAQSTVKEDKSAPEANGIVDNEDSINLTIGEDEAKMLADEEDSSQEKYNKDESHGRASHKKISVGEKLQDKSNQEKMDGKSSTTSDKAVKDEKSKKILIASGGSSKNLWVSGLATTTRATDLKQVFSKYGKVIGAKVVTNARTPGARCYGYVTMANPEDATKAVQFLHHTELHGRLISVEKAKGDSTGPPKRSEPSKTESPAKKIDDKKKEQTIRKIDLKKEETLVPPGTEGEVKEPEVPGTEKDVSDVAKEGGHKSRELVRSADRPEKRPRSASSSHRSRGSPVLTFDKIKEERERQRLRERERILREEERRRETERMRQREIDRKQREEYERLEREKKKLKMERERLLREKDELLKLKSERQRLERERQKLEREKLEKEKEELERLKRINMRLEEETRRKRSLSASREYESRKRPASDARFAAHHTTQPRYPEPQSRSSDYKKDSSHKSSRDVGRPGYEPETRRMVTAVSSREGWPPKERESGRYERSSTNSNSFRDETISSRSKTSESRHVRERYGEAPKSDRFVERGDSWHASASGGSGPLKTFSRDTWVSGDRKQDVTEVWARPSTNSSRWPGNSTSMGIGSRSGPPGSMSSPMFSASSAQGMPGINMAMSMGSFSGGERFDAYKQPYFKGP